MQKQGKWVGGKTAIGYMKDPNDKNKLIICEPEAEIVKTIFENITDEERSIIVLHVVTGFKHREIAKMLDLSLSTVLSKYNRAIKKLRKILEEDMI